MNTKSFEQYETRMVEMVFPTQTNHYGTLFGGHALALMDKSAFITASRYARRSMVTASSERIDFKTPVKVGYLVEAIGRIVKRGNSSVTVNGNCLAKIYCLVKDICVRMEILCLFL